MRIVSPMPTGNGAYVLHEQLAAHIAGYKLRPYSPWWTMLPPALPIFARGQAGLIHATSDYGMFFKRAGIPLVVTLHNYVCDRFMRPYSSYLRYLHYRTDLRLFTRRTLKVADEVVAPSRFVMERARRDLGINISARLIYNGIDECLFTPSLARSQHDGRQFRVLFCGNLNRRKRAELLVPLANALGESFEVCYTQGLATNSRATERLGQSAARLRNLGIVRHGDMPEIYRQMDVLFMPSAREGFGLCVAEAMACGLPVVAASGSAMDELVVDEKGGALCSVDDVDSFADAIRSIADSQHLKEQMGQFNRVRVEELFTLRRMVGAYQELFEQVLNR